MTPKEKAIELVECFAESIKPVTFGVLMERDWNSAKQCALIAVNEILINNCGAYTDGQQAYEDELYCDEYFWEEVKTELKKL